MTRIKEDIVREIMTKKTLDRKEAKKLVESLLTIIKDSLSAGDDVLISGFGQFRIKHKKARVGRNPITKVEYEISERTVVTFYSSKVFRQEMNYDSIMRKLHRNSLINQIQGHDKQIQCYVEEDYPNTLEELQKLTITELQDLSDRRLAELQFLTDDINIDETDQIAKS